MNVFMILFQRKAGRISKYHLVVSDGFVHHCGTGCQANVITDH